MTRDVTVYYATGLISCHQAMEFLSQQGVQFIAKNVAEDSQAREEVVQRIGRMSVPVIVVSNDVVVGFDRGASSACWGLGD
ncbi:MAG: glutaredoxin domain-containing protein [Candidatus Methylomirabilales bacterium]